METNIIERKSTFINLSNKTFAEYSFVYSINDTYSINELTKFSNKQQLLFQRIKNQNQNLNLLFVDSVFSNILADLTLEVFINNTKTFNQYLSSINKIKLVDEKNEQQFYKYKFFNFIHFLLYSEIALNKIYDGEINTDIVYCQKNTSGEIEYFSIYDQAELQLKLLDDLQLEINMDSSNISNQIITLCLRISHK